MHNIYSCFHAWKTGKFCSSFHPLLILSGGVLRLGNVYSRRWGGKFAGWRESIEEVQNRFG